MLSLKFIRVSKRVPAVAATLALSFAGLVAGVAAPASATTTNARQVGGVTLLSTGSVDRVVEKDGFIYMLDGGNGSGKLFRASATDASIAPTLLVDVDPNIDDYSTSSCRTRAALGDSVTNLANPTAMTVFGNDLYVLNCAASTNNSVVKFSLSDTSATSLTGTVVANSSSIGTYVYYTDIAIASNGRLLLANAPTYSTGSIETVPLDGNSQYSTTKSSFVSAPTNEGPARFAKDANGDLFAISIPWQSPRTLAARFFEITTPTEATGSMDEIATVASSRDADPNFAIDQATGDFLYTINYGTSAESGKVHRLVKGAATDWATTEVAVQPTGAVAPVSTITLDTVNAISNKTTLDVVTSSAINVAVGDKANSGSFSGSGMYPSSFNGATVIAVTDSTHFKIRTDYSISNTTYTGFTFDIGIERRLGYVSALAATSNGIFMGLSSYMYDAATSTYKSGVMRSVALQAPRASKASTGSAFHRGLSVSWSTGASVLGIDSMEAQIWAGATADASLAAATSASTSPVATCVPSSALSVNNTLSCAIYEGLETGKYYTTRIKSTNAAGSTLSVAPVATTTPYISQPAVLVSDLAPTATLPAESPTGTGPGYAHISTAGTGSAIALLRSARPRKSVADGQGGVFYAIQSGASAASPVSIVHLLADGTIDTTLGSGGVQDFAQENSLRTITLATFGSGADVKWAVQEYFSSTGVLRITSQTSATTSETLTYMISDLNSMCAAQFTNANPTQYNTVRNTGTPVLISSSASEPLILANCLAPYTFATQAGSINNMPVLVTVSADNTVEVFSSLLGDPTAAELEASGAKPCLGSLQASFAAATGTTGKVATLLYPASSMASAMCSWNASSSTGYAFQIADDGVVTKVSTGKTYDNMSNYPPVFGQNFAGLDGETYLSNNSGMSSTTYSKLKADGTWDSSFGSSGSLTLAGPSCMAAISQVVGVVEGALGRRYLAAYSIVNGVSSGSTPAPKKVTPIGILVNPGTTTDRVGSTVMGVTAEMTNLASSYSNAADGGVVFNNFGSNAATGEMYFAYFKNDATGVANVTWDSFESALPAGDDPIECAPSPFVSTTNGTSGMYGLKTTVPMSGGKFFIAGNSGSNSGKQEIFTPGSDPVAGTFSYTTGAPVTAREGAIVAPLQGDKVLIAAGSYWNPDTSSSQRLATAEIYNNATGLFTATTGNMTKHRNGATVQLLANGKVLIMGGDDGNYMSTPVSYTDAELFDPATGRFTAISTGPGAVRPSMADLGGGKWLVTGGYSNITSATKIYDEATNAFTAGPTLGSNRRGSTVVSLGGGRVLIAGSASVSMVGGVPNSVLAEVCTDTACTPLGSAAPRSLHSATAVVLASGKVLFMFSGISTLKLNPSTGVYTAGEDRAIDTSPGRAYVLSSGKVLLTDEMTTSNYRPLAKFTVYTPPAEAVAPVMTTAPRVLKGTTGSVTFRLDSALTTGKTSVVFSNAGSSNVLLANVTIAASKVVLSADKKSVTVALPTVAQLKKVGTAYQAGQVVVTIKSGATGVDIAGTSAVQYIDTLDVPVINATLAASYDHNTSTVSVGATAVLGGGLPSTVTYATATSEVCTVSSAGVVTRVARGTCTINVTVAKGLGNSAKTQPFSFVFAKTPQTVAFDVATPTTLPLVEDPTEINAVATSGLAVDYEIAADSDEVCGIDDEGMLTALTLGTCVVTAVQAGDATYAPATLVSTTIEIANPSAPVVDTPGAVIGDGVFGAILPGDTMASVEGGLRYTVAKTMNFGRGFKVKYVPTVKSGKVTAITLTPSITSAYAGSIVTTFSVPSSVSATVPVGWKKVGSTYTCTPADYGVKTRQSVAKTKTYLGKACVLTPSKVITAGLKVTVKNVWKRTNAKTQVSVGDQKRTAVITLRTS
jgi:uncharacterized protein YqkB